MLVGAVDRGVHAHRPVDIARRVGLGEQPGVDLVPGAVQAEAVVALPHRLPWPEVGWQVTPRDPGTEAGDDPLDHLPVITERTAALTLRGRQERLDPSPMSVIKDSCSRHPAKKSSVTGSLLETRPSVL